MNEHFEDTNDKDESAVSARVENPFKYKAQLAAPVSASAEGQLAVSAAREVAEVQGMVFMAKQFPRDKVRAMDRILNDCTRPRLAENAL